MRYSDETCLSDLELSRLLHTAGVHCRGLALLDALLCFCHQSKERKPHRAKVKATSRKRHMKHSEEGVMWFHCSIFRCKCELFWDQKKFHLLLSGFRDQLRATTVALCNCIFHTCWRGGWWRCSWLLMSHSRQVVGDVCLLSLPTDKHFWISWS